MTGSTARNLTSNQTPSGDTRRIGAINNKTEVTSKEVAKTPETINSVNRIISNEIRDSDHSQLGSRSTPLLATRAEKKVAATISAISSTSAHIDCEVGEEEIAIVLPLNLVPEQLRKYGQAVWVSMSDVDGIRGLHVDPRIVVNSMTGFDLTEIEDWIKSN